MQKRQKKMQNAQKRTGFPKAFLHFFSENRIIILAFLLSTAFFVYQRHASFSWDYSVYMLNAKYWLTGSGYYEPFRPPLMPFILSIFSVFGWLAAGYVYAVAVSALFAYSSVKLADSLKVNRAVFYILSLNPFVLKLGLYSGTELLSFAFFELFLASLISKKASGHWIGLAALARYPPVFFAPLIIFHRRIREIAKNAIYFALPFIPWFLYNRAKFGNIFLSIADSYANNVKFRGYIDQPFNFLHLGAAVNFLIPFFIVGAIYAAYALYSEFRKAKSLKLDANVIFEKRIAEAIMVIVFIMSLYSYNNLPVKDIRYIFNISAPAIYFAVLGINYIGSKTRLPNLKTAIIGFLVMLNIAGAAVEMHYETEEIYMDAIDRMDKIGIGECAVRSNAWPLLSYLGKTSHRFPPEELVGHYIREGYHVLLFNRIKEPSYIENKSFLHSFPVIYEDKNYIILGNSSKCLPIQTVDTTYVGTVNDFTMLTKNETIETEPCNVLFSGEIMRKFCNIANLRLG